MLGDNLIIAGIIFFCAIVGTLLASRLKQPVILGLLVVGMFIGPNFMGIINEPGLIEILIEVGSILFLFGIGMEFSLKKLSKIGMKGMIVAFLKIGIMFFFGFLAATLLHLDIVTAMFLGVIVSFSSTMISVNVLKQRKLMKRHEVPMLIAILIIEDIVGVIALTFFSVIHETGRVGVIFAIEKLIISLSLLLGAYFVFSYFAEKIVALIASPDNDENIMFIGFAMCLGFSYFALWLGLSASAGAFLAGSIVSGLRDSKKFESAAKPHRMLFTVLFFIAMGMMIDVTSIAKYFWIILAFTVVFVGGILLSVGLVTKVFAGFNTESSIFSSIAMSPMGVFSLLIAKESRLFDVSVDLVTITSVLILILAFSMSLLISYHKSIARIFSKNAYKKSAFVAYTEVLTNYFILFFEKLELESTVSRRLKRTFLSFVNSKIAFLFVTSVSFKFGRYLLDKFTSIWMHYLIYIFLSMIVLVVFIYSFNATVKFFKNYVVFTTYLDESRFSKKRAVTLIRNMLLFFGTMIFALMFPTVLFILDLSAKYLVVSFALIILSFYFMRKSVYLLKERYVSLSTDYSKQFWKNKRVTA